MATPDELGLVTPDGQDWTRDGDNAITTNAEFLASFYTQQQNANAIYDMALPVRRDYTALPANVDDWIGYAWEGIWPVPVEPSMFAGLPTGLGLCTFVIIPMGTGGSMVRILEYGGEQRVFSRAVSSTPSNNTAWKRQDPTTRRVLHQLTMPGSPTLTDTEPTRHVRLPIKLAATVHGPDITFKNYNERSGTNFGDLTFEDVYVARMAVGTFGQPTPNFAEPPINLGKPVVTGSGDSRRYQLLDTKWVAEKNTEYILSYAYTDPDSSPNQLSISGSFNGTNPAGVGATSVTNQWSQYTPLEVYLSMDVPTDVRTEAFFDSSSGTGLNSAWPLRDSWAWRTAEAHGSLPVMLCMSGQTTKAFAAGGFVWTKLGVFAPVDAAWIASGSNDSQSYPLEEMKTDFIALADRIRDRNVSQSIFACNFFPRAAESSTVKERRLGYDAWLFGELPGGILAAYDRAKPIEGANGLMRPELDSGDGTHVNTKGQHLMSAAVTTGGVADEETRVMLLTHSSISAGNVYLVSRGKTVNLICEGLKFTATGSVTLTDFIPEGYRPRGQVFGAARNYWGTDTSELYRITASGSLAVLSVTSATQINIAETWIAV